MESARELFEHELCILYDAETKAIRSLGRMAMRCSDPELVQVYKDYQLVAEKRLDRLDEVFALIGIKPDRIPCAGMNGLLEEFSDFLEIKPSNAVLDAFAVESARRIERYEVCAYQALITLAVALRLDEVTDLLLKSLGDHNLAGGGFKALTINLTEKLIEPEPEPAPEPDPA
jgi:ferritin-like metal-binding protein YciE